MGCRDQPDNVRLDRHASLLTPHGVTGLFEVSTRTSQSPTPNPSWGDGTRRVVVVWAIQVRLLTPHGVTGRPSVDRLQSLGFRLLTPHGVTGPPPLTEQEMKKRDS